MSDIDEDDYIDTAESGTEEAHSSAESNFSRCRSSGPDSPAQASSSYLVKKSKKPKTEMGKRERGESRLKRLRPFYNNDYRNLFNDTVNEIVEGNPVEAAGLIPPKQIGVTVWSSQEFKDLFIALAKMGRHNLPGIASAIGTKTELEVHVCIQLLQNATVEQHKNGPRHDLFEYSDIPAAFEVGQDCCTSLELNADALSVLQQEEENRLERKKYGELWRLEWRIAHWVDHQSQKEDGDVNPLEALPAAELLNLGSFLELSENVFMNSSVAEDNWRSHRGEKIPISITYTAFSDIHRLAISLTKRLVQSSLFIAMSRIRSTKTKLEQFVQPKDIRAALNLLGMKHNSRSFWIQAPRRCNLAVYRQSGREKQLSYDEVERRLSRGWKIRMKRVNQPDKSDKQSVKESTSWSPSNSEADSEDQYVSDQMNTGAINTTAPSVADSNSLYSRDEEGNSPFRHDEGSSDDSQDPTDYDEDPDLYAEAVDNCASQLEEQRLWKLMGRESPANVLAPEKMELPKRQQPERRTGDDLDDWRAWTEYAPEWESHESPIPANGYNQLKRNRRTRASFSSHVRTPVEADSNTSDDEVKRSKAMRAKNQMKDEAK